MKTLLLLFVLCISFGTALSCQTKLASMTTNNTKQSGLNNDLNGAVGKGKTELANADGKGKISVGVTKEIRDLLKILNTISVRNKNTVFVDAKSYLLKNDLYNAEKVILNAIFYNKISTEYLNVAFFYLGVIYYKLGIIDKSIKFLIQSDNGNDICLLDPKILLTKKATTKIKAFDYWFRLGRENYKSNRFAKAIICFYFCRALYCNHSGSLAYRAFSYFNYQRYDQAIKDCSMLINIEKETNYKWYELRAMAFQKKKQYNKAKYDLDTAISINPKNHKLYFERALNYSLMNDYKKALEDCSTAIEIDGKQPIYYFNRALFWGKVRSPLKEIIDLYRVRVIAPKWPQLGVLIKEREKRLANRLKPKIAGFHFVPIYSGVYEYGNSKWERRNITINHCNLDVNSIKINFFYILDSEVTENNFSYIKNGYLSGVDKPKTNINYFDARLFCKVLNKKYPGFTFDIPTEIEWEIACRGG